MKELISDLPHDAATILALKRKEEDSDARMPGLHYFRSQLSNISIHGLFSMHNIHIQLQMKKN